MLFGLLFVSSSSFIRSKRKRQKDARTDYIHLPTRSKRCNRFTIQMGGGNSTHSRSIGKKKTQNGSRNVASIFKQRAREILKNRKFENNNPPFFLSFWHWKWLSSSVNQHWGPNSTLLVFFCWAGIEHNNNTDSNRFVFLLYFDENSKLLSVFRSNFVFSQRHTQYNTHF